MSKVTIIHNIIAPYRIPVFNEICKSHDLKVLFCKEISKDRKWSTKIENVLFTNKILSSFTISKIVINPFVLIEFLKDKSEVIIIGENPANFFTNALAILLAKIKKQKILVWSERITTAKYFTEKTSITRKLLRIIWHVFEHVTQNVMYYTIKDYIAYSEKARIYLLQKGITDENITSGKQIFPEELLTKQISQKKDTMYKDKIVTLYLGYFNSRKGIEELAEAFLKINNPKKHLILAGTGESFNQIKDKYKKYDCIEFPGYVDGKKKEFYFAVSDIFVLFTKNDPWGLTINEAIYYNTPIITTDMAAGSEIVEKSGIVIRCNDNIALKQNLHKLYSNKSIRDAMRKYSEKRTDATDTKIGAKPFIQAIQRTLQ